MKIWLRAALIFIIFNSLGLASAQTPKGTLAKIIGSRSSLGPTVEADIVVYSDGQAVTNLTPANFTIQGDTPTNLKADPRSDGPLSTVILIDLGRGADITLIQQTLKALFSETSSFFQDGDDMVFYLISGDDNFTTKTIETRSQALDAINQFQVGNNYGKPAPVLTRALEALITARYPNRQAVLVGSLLYDQSGKDGAIAGFRTERIPLYTIQAHNNRSTGGYSEIATELKTLFVNNNEGQYSGNGVPTGELLGLIQRIALNRTYYHVSYISTNLSQEPQTVEIQVSGSGVSGLKDSFTYTPEYADPAVTIVAPTTLNVVRTYREDGSLDTPQTLVYIQVDYTDQPRNLKYIQLDVQNGTGEALPPQRIENISYVAGQPLTIPWTLESYNVQDTNTSVVLRVTIEDAVGKKAEFSQTGSVRVEAVPEIVITRPPDPIIEIIEPRPIAPKRRLLAANGTAFDVNTQKIVVHVVLPVSDAGITDPLAKLTFNVGKRGTSEIKQTKDVTGVTPTQDGRVEFEWDLQPYNVIGKDLLWVSVEATTQGGQTLTTGPVDAEITVEAALVEKVSTVCAAVGIGAGACPLPPEVDVPLFIGLAIAIPILLVLVFYFAFTKGGRERVGNFAEAAQTRIERAATQIFGVERQPENNGGSGSQAGLGELVVLEGEGTVQTIRVTKNEFTVGRSYQAGSDAILEGNGISRRHFTIRFENRNFTIEDLESGNGTYLNGKKLRVNHVSPLKPNDVITVHKTRLEWRPQVGSEHTTSLEIYDDVSETRLEQEPVVLPPQRTVAETKIQSDVKATRMLNDPDSRLPMEGLRNGFEEEDDGSDQTPFSM